MHHLNDGDTVNWSSFNGGFDIAERRPTPSPSARAIGRQPVSLTKAGSGTLVLTNGNNATAAARRLPAARCGWAPPVPWGPATGAVTLTGGTLDLGGNSPTVGAPERQRRGHDLPGRRHAGHRPGQRQLLLCRHDQRHRRADDQRRRQHAAERQQQLQRRHDAQRLRHVDLGQLAGPGAEHAGLRPQQRATQLRHADGGHAGRPGGHQLLLPRQRPEQQFRQPAGPGEHRLTTRWR